MGLFDKAKKVAQQGGMVHVRGAGPIDTAIIGGPSTRSVAADDPIWQPINGVSLQDYAISHATRRPAVSTTKRA